jgi:tetratricopeptide (TPR) repeat protein
MLPNPGEGNQHLMRFASLALLSAAAVATPAQAEWREAVSDHFIIYSEQGEKPLREFAERLERFDAAMRFLRGLPNEPVGRANKLNIYVLSNVGAVQKLYGKGGSSGSFNIAGFYSPRASGSVAFTPRSAGDDKFDLNAETVLRHEYAHHFMMNNFPAAYPAWFIEGFAEFNSSARFEKDGTVGIGAPALHRAYGLLQGVKLPAETLIAKTDAELKGEERESIYGRGWLLTHYLTFEPSRRGQLKDYLQRLGKGETSLTAGKAAFGDLKTLDKELDRYLNRPRLSYLPIAPDKLPIGRIAIRSVSPGEDAVMEVKMRSRRGVNREQALQLLPLVRKAAAPFQADPSVQATLAEAEYDAGNFTEAEAAADRALAVDPKLVDALIYKGRAKMARAEASNASDAATWKEVRKWLIAANRADPEDPEPLILYYSSFQEQGIQPTANATVGLIEALHLAPHDRGLRMMAAFQYLVDGKTAEARAALASIAFDPHGGAMSKVAATAIAKIDSGAGKDALQLLRNAPDEEDGQGSKGS